MTSPLVIQSPSRRPVGTNAVRLLVIASLTLAMMPNVSADPFMVDDARDVPRMIMDCYTPRGTGDCEDHNDPLANGVFVCIPHYLEEIECFVYTPCPANEYGAAAIGQSTNPLSFCSPLPGPQGAQSCAVYNAENGDPYPGETGVVLLLDPNGPEGDVPVCATPIIESECGALHVGYSMNGDGYCNPDVTPCDGSTPPATVGVVIGTTPYCYSVPTVAPCPGGTDVPPTMVGIVLNGSPACVAVPPVSVDDCPGGEQGAVVNGTPVCASASVCSEWMPGPGWQAGGDVDGNDVCTPAPYVGAFPVDPNCPPAATVGLNVYLPGSTEPDYTFCF